MTSLKSVPPIALYAPSDGLFFDPQEHRYVGYDEDTCETHMLTSVTQVIKSFSVEFDPVAQSERMAARDGTDAQALRDKWAANAAEASIKGTCVHNFIEDICRSMPRGYFSIPTSTYHPYLDLIQGVARFFIDHIEMAQGWAAPEFRAWLPQYRLAGTIDMVASNYRGVPSIIDWKTNKSLEVEGYQNMLPPFQRGKLALPDTNLYHYFLQLNLYRHILMTRYNFEPECMVIVHIEPGRYTEYDVPVMDAHVEKILERLQVDE
jgi:hypothetical protein